MKALCKIIICFLLVVGLSIPSALAYNVASFDKAYSETQSYLKSLGTPSVGSVGGEWLVIALTRAGEECPEGYYENVLNFVEKKINEKEQLHKSKSTDNSRVILGLASAGYDPRNIGGHDLVYGLTDMTYLRKQGPNGPIWALIALDCQKYEIPQNPDAAEQTTREGLIAQILSNRLEDGGWAMSGKSADPDLTAMAIQALAPYYSTTEEVKLTVDTALAVLSQKQHANGGFGSIDGACSESCAQVIVALTSLGIDPAKDERFIKNSNTVIDAILEFTVEDGGFAHIPGGSLNGMATEQAAYALVAYQRFLESKSSLYDMTEPESTQPENNNGSADNESSSDTPIKDEQNNPENIGTSSENTNTSDSDNNSADKNSKPSANESTDNSTKDESASKPANSNSSSSNTAKPQTNATTNATAAQTDDGGIFVHTVIALCFIAVAFITGKKYCFK